MALSLSLVACTGHVIASEDNVPARPNIVLILADDMGWSDIGSYGGEISTPNLDTLANKGIRFTQFHNTAKCSTSRASLLTGLYAQQVDMGRIRISTIKNGVTLAEILREAGYHTLAVGKHHGKDNLFERGFDHYWGLRDGATNHFNPGIQRQGEPAPAFKRKPRTWCFDGDCFAPFTPKDKKYYSSDTFTDWSIELLNNLYATTDKQTDKPFFLYLSFQAPHDPLQAWPEDIAKYRGKYQVGFNAIAKKRYQRQREMGLIDESFQYSQPTRRQWDELTPKQQDDQDLRMAVYAAMIDNMDQNIGRLLARLKALGKADNTLILFASDNGSNPSIVDTGDGEIGNIDRWASLGGDWANVSNTPLRLYKNDSFQGGISTPLIAHWPDGIQQPGAVSEFVGHFIDFMPTLLELSGATYPSSYEGETVFPFEGVSLLPVIQGKENAFEQGKLTRAKPIFWQWGLGKAVRDGHWKLVSSDRFGIPNRGEWQLYDMQTDKSETNNLAQQHPEIVNKMVAQYEHWWQQLPENHEGGFLGFIARSVLWYFLQTESHHPEE